MRKKINIIGLIIGLLLTLFFGRLSLTAPKDVLKTSWEYKYLMNHDLIVPTVLLFLAGILLLIIFSIRLIIARKKAKYQEYIDRVNSKSNNTENGTEFEFRRVGVAPVYVTIQGNWLSIDRKGVYNALNHGLDGVKKIHLKNVSAVQLKEASSIAAGYIQLVIIGSQESKAGLLAANSDENTIMFGTEYNELAKKLVNLIESKIDELQVGQVAATTTIIQQPTQSVAQQIKEFKESLDSGIITQEEFNTKKAELLK